MNAGDPALWRAGLQQIVALTGVAPPAGPLPDVGGDRPVLIITRGLPASGKSTRAVAWVKEQPDRRARVNRDSLRTMMHGGRRASLAQEAMVTVSQHTSVRNLLVAGFDVVADDTNLPSDAVDAFRQIAAEAGARFEIWDFTTIVSLEECLRRDARRTDADQVGEAAIRRLYRQHLAPAPEEH